MLVGPDVSVGAAAGGPGLTVTLYGAVVTVHPVAVITSVTVTVPAPEAVHLISTELVLFAPTMVPRVVDHR